MAGRMKVDNKNKLGVRIWIYLVWDKDQCEHDLCVIILCDFWHVKSVHTQN